MRPPGKKVLKGIGGLGEIIGEVTIQIEFKNLKMTIDFDFALMKNECPSLLSNKDMIERGLDIRLQWIYLHVGPLSQPLHLEIYFFIHNWPETDTPYALYKENDLRRIHRGFGHTSVGATYKIL